MGGGGEGERSHPLGGWGESGGGLSLVVAAAAGDRSGGAGDSPADSGKQDQDRYHRHKTA